MSKRKSEGRKNYLKNVKIQKLSANRLDFNGILMMISAVGEGVRGFIFTTGLKKEGIATKEAFNWLRENSRFMNLVRIEIVDWDSLD